MKPRTIVKTLSWLLLVSGLLGLLATLAPPSMDPVSPMPAVCMLAISMAGFMFLAYLDR